MSELVLTETSHLGAFFLDIPIEQIGVNVQKNWTKQIKDIKDLETLLAVLVEVSNLFVTFWRDETGVYDRLRDVGKLLAGRVPMDVVTVQSGRRTVSLDMFFRL